MNKCTGTGPFDRSKPKILTCLSGFGGEDVLRLPLSSSLIAIIKPTQLNTEGIWIGPGGRKQKAGCKKTEKTPVGTTNIIHDFLHIPSGWVKIRWQNQLPGCP